jgi:hypothetical protein
LEIAGENLDGPAAGTHFTTFNDALTKGNKLDNWRIDRTDVDTTCNMLFGRVASLGQIHATVVVGPDRYHKYWDGTYSDNVLDHGIDTGALDTEQIRMATAMTSKVQTAKDRHGRVGNNDRGQQLVVS